MLGGSRYQNVLIIKWCIDEQGDIFFLISNKILSSHLCLVFFSFDHFQPILLNDSWTFHPFAESYAEMFTIDAYESINGGKGVSQRR